MFYSWYVGLIRFNDLPCFNRPFLPVEMGIFWRQHLSRTYKNEWKRWAKFTWALWHKLYNLIDFKGICKVAVLRLIFCSQCNNILQNELLETLRTSYFTRRRGRYHGVQETMTTPQLLTSRMCNLTKIEYAAAHYMHTHERFLLIITRVRFALHVRLTFGKQVKINSYF